MTNLAEMTPSQIDARAQLVRDEMKRRIDLVSSDFFFNGEFSVAGAFIMMADESVNSYLPDDQQIEDFD